MRKEPLVCFWLAPAVVARVRRKETLTTFLEIYNPTLQAKEPSVDVRLGLRRKGQTLSRTVSKHLDYLTRGDLTKISYALDLSLAKRSPGPYELEVQVTDTPSGKRSPARRPSRSCETRRPDFPAHVGAGPMWGRPMWGLTPKFQKIRGAKNPKV